MTQSGQGEEPSQRQAREGIVLPSDGGEPLLPGMLGGQTGHQAGPYAGQQSGPYNGQQSGPYGGAQSGTYGGQQTGASAPPEGQAWGTPWGPEQQQYQPQSPAPQPGQGWPAPPDQSWGAPEPSQPLPPEGTPAQPYGGPPRISQPAANMPLPPAAADGGQSLPLPPAVDEGATQYIPPVAGPGGAGQYLPPVAAAADEQATQYIPPVAPGALPPEVQGGESVSEATQFLGRAPYAGAGPLPPASGPDAEATQYIPPVTGAGAPYGMPQGGDRQPPAEFDNLFRSGPGGESPAAATQYLPRFEQPEAAPYGQPAPQASYAQPGPSYAPPGDGGRGGRPRSRVPLIAAVGIGIVVLGVGAGALLAGGGGDDGGDKNQPVSATAPATDGSASPSADPAKQQAVALDKLLADSGDSRASVIRAVANVKGCNNLDTAASDLRDAAKQRNQLVTRLSGLSVDKLPNNAALTDALTKAWQASASADNHYAAWADQVAGNKKSCRKGQARGTGQTQAGNRASGTASQQKVKAAQLWNAIAKTYGLTQRQPVQL
ncbi:hypothetical protein ACFY1L_23705 [Streptomyces sp. NPDC001663]|uniref:hypothetical protein n=1 Tax=Streptomyces sp. NPDC001663 TaxID=3364597 RepID=UPI00368B18B1